MFLKELVWVRLELQEFVWHVSNSKKSTRDIGNFGNVYFGP